MSKILVTGANGFIAAQILIASLKEDYIVVAQVRTQGKADETKIAIEKAVPEKISNLSFVIVPKIEAEGAFDEVIKANSFYAVLHTATPFHYNFNTPAELLEPAIGSTKSILKSVKDFGPTVKRVIITSSFASVIHKAALLRPGYVYTEKDWNPISWETTNGTDKSDTYFGAKTFAEKAAWEFIETEKPTFDLVSINPPMVYGPVAQYVKDAEHLNTSSRQLYNVLYGIDTEVAPQTIVGWVNVKDVAAAHVKAITAKGASNQRFIIANEQPFYHKQFSDIFIAKYPELAPKIPTKLPEGVDPETGAPIGGHWRIDNSFSKSVLGIEYTSLEDTLVQFAESIKDLDKE